MSSLRHVWGRKHFQSWPSLTLKEPLASLTWWLIVSSRGGPDSASGSFTVICSGKVLFGFKLLVLDKRQSVGITVIRSDLVLGHVQREEMHRVLGRGGEVGLGHQGQDVIVEGRHGWGAQVCVVTVVGLVIGLEGMKGAESGGGELLGAVSCHRHWRALESRKKKKERI